jgi:hypothetical protein
LQSKNNNNNDDDNVAETSLDIPRILEPLDFLEGRPDELAVMTYIVFIIIIIIIVVIIIIIIIVVVVVYYIVLLSLCLLNL